MPITLSPVHPRNAAACLAPPLTVTPLTKSQLSSVPPNLTGAIQPQNPTAAINPVKLAAKNPATLFLGDNGILMRGNL